MGSRGLLLAVADGRRLPKPRSIGAGQRFGDLGLLKSGEYRRGRLLDSKQPSSSSSPALFSFKRVFGIVPGSSFGVEARFPNFDTLGEEPEFLRESLVLTIQTG